MGEWLELRCMHCATRHPSASPKLLGRFLGGSLLRHGIVEMKCPYCHTVSTITNTNAESADYLSTFPEGAFRRRRITPPMACASSG